MKSLILAAGKGSRLGLEDIPKPMFELNGKPVLEHNVLLLKKHNVKDIFINLHHKGHVIENHFQDGSHFGVSIKYSKEEKLLGTAGGVKKLEPEFKDSPIFIVYGDNYTDIDLTAMLSFHKSNNSACTIAVFDPRKSKNSGIAGGKITIDRSNNITSFIEGNNSDIDGYVNAGVYILEPSILNIIPKDSESDFGKDIFPKLLEDKISLKAYVTESFVLAIDTEDALSNTKEELKG